MPRPLAVGHHVTLRDHAGNELRDAQVVGLWRRDETLYATRAPSFRDMAIALLDATAAEVVALVCSQGGVPMFVGRKGCIWFDGTGEPIEVKLS